MKGKRITRITADQARRMADKTNWARLRKLTDAEITKAAREDPDAPILTPEFWKNTRLVLPAPPRKETITMKVDHDVVAHFRRGGRGYQTRMNAVLRAYVEQARDTGAGRSPSRRRAGAR